VLFASPHSPRLVLFGKSLAGIVIGSAQAMLVLVIAALVPAIDLEWQYGLAAGLLLSVLAVALLAVFLNGFAQLVASRIRTMQGFHLVMNLLLFPLLFFSGAFFPLDEVPVWLKLLATVNPLSYPVDLLRLAVYAEGSAYFGLAVDLPLLALLGPMVFLWGIRRQPAPVL